MTLIQIMYYIIFAMMIIHVFNRAVVVAANICEVKVAFAISCATPATREDMSQKCADQINVTALLTLFQSNEESLIYQIDSIISLKS